MSCGIQAPIACGSLHQKPARVDDSCCSCQTEGDMVGLLTATCKCRQLPTAQEWWMLSQSQTHNTRPASASSRNPPSAAKQSGAAMALWREGHLGKGLVDSGKPTPARSAGTPTRSSNVGASRAAAAQSGLVPEPARKELLALSRLLLLEQTSMEHDIKRCLLFPPLHDACLSHLLLEQASMEHDIKRWLHPFPCKPSAFLACNCVPPWS